MPIFGDYETFEEVAVHEQPGHVTTVYKAKKLGGRAETVYAVKVFIPHLPPDPVQRSEEELGEDPTSSFIEGIKRLKQAHATGGAGLVPVHDFGMTDGGAWFATDYCQRQSIGEFIIRQFKPDSEALRHVVSSVVKGCLTLKRATGGSHGGLRPSNILLAGTGNLPLRKTPLQLMDPYPASHSVINKLSPSDRETVTTMLEEALELQDLRCIGELIFQLVEQRLVRGYDYNLPTSTSPAWTGLGKDGEYWRELCLKLLDPNLTLEKVSLESLAAEFPPPKVGKLPLIIAGTVVLALLAGGGLFAWKAIGSKVERARVEAAAKYEAAMAAGQKAFGNRDWQSALDQAKAALTAKAGDSAATKLKTDAESELARAATAAENERRYQAAIAAGQEAFGRRDWQTALDQAKVAMSMKANDAAATKLKSDAEDELAKAAAASETERKYQTALAAGRQAFGNRDWQTALDQASVALTLKANDAAATKLKTDAEGELARSAISAENERKYQTAMTAGRQAFGNRDWQSALDQAKVALSLKANDAAATKLKADAEGELAGAAAAAENERKYQAAMASGQKAFGNRDWQGALDQAKLALSLKANDAAAARLKTNSEEELARAAAAVENERKYKTAMAAGQKAFDDGNWQEAETQADTALLLKRDDPDAAKLKTAAQAKASEATDLAGARASFERGDYAEALRLCRLHAGVESFDTLSTKAGEEDAVLKAAQQQSVAADYSFITEVEKKSYAAKPPFQQLLREAKSEQSALANLEALKQQGDWRALQAQSQNLGAQVLAKNPFASLVTWAATQEEQERGRMAQRLGEYDSRLRDLCDWFNVKVPKAIDVRGRPKKSRMTALGYGCEDNPNKKPYLGLVSKLREGYGVLGVLQQDDRQRTLDDLQDTICKWE